MTMSPKAAHIRPRYPSRPPGPLPLPTPSTKAPPAPRPPILYSVPPRLPFDLSPAGLQELEIRSTACITQDDLDWLQASEGPQTRDFRQLLGLAPCIQKDGRALQGLAVGNLRRCLYVDCTDWRTDSATARQSIALLSEHILTSATVLCVGLDFVVGALRIRRDFGRDVSGVDVSSLLPDEEPKSAADIVVHLLGRGRQGFASIARFWRENGRSEEHGAVFSSVRAWLTLSCALHPSRLPAVEDARELDTRRIGDEQVHFFSTANHVTTCIEALKPFVTKGDFSAISSVSAKGEVVISNSKFTTKTRKDPAQSIRIRTADGGTINGASVISQNGRTTTISTGAGKVDMLEYEIIGRASGTVADSQWKLYLRQALDGSLSVYDSEHCTRILWAGSRRQRQRRDARPVRDDSEALSEAAQRLNESQRQAHDAIVSLSDPGATTLITGPPGTGKTSVIAAAVQTWLLRNPTPSTTFAYCVTASNAAAKNIAEALANRGFPGFRLVVSQEFYHEWHEHRYRPNLNLITSSDLPAGLKLGDLDQLIGDARVVICTLAMLSSRSLMVNGFFSRCKMAMLLVDEASQIRLDQYPHVLHRFRASLERVAFFGDDRQLSPYQSAQIPEIQTVFQLPHLRASAHFLNTQYRMPTKLAAVISKFVYQNQLQSASTVAQSEDSVKFVDVATGYEEYSGTSAKNVGEVDAVVTLVRQYYAESDFKVITPYDGQRNEIEAKLRAAALPWQDRVFNVDSFQGQESDIIIVSVTKTAKLGFLNEIRRCNVMLTRCKKAMVLVTNRHFLETTAKSTLIGRLSTALGPSSWLTDQACEVGSAVLPCGKFDSSKTRALAPAIEDSWSAPVPVEESSQEQLVEGVNKWALGGW